MLARQRQGRILEQLETTGHVRVIQLAETFDVTEETIRRDLNQLDRAGKLRRTHGGAVSVEPDRLELPFDVRQATLLPEKRSVAARAVQLVEEGDVIALDASTTTCEFARQLPDMAVTVLTNSIAITTILSQRRQVRVVSTGGMLDPAALAFSGPLAEDMLLRFNIHKFFLSCRGVDFARGLSEATDQHARLKRRITEVAERAYLLADHSKFNVRSVVFFAALADMTGLVTNRKALHAWPQEFQALNIPVYQAED